MIPFLFSRSFFKDRQAILLFIGLTLLMLGNVVLVLVLLSERNYQIPVRYSGYGVGVIERGQWYALYVLPVFSFVTYLVNLMLAVKVHQLRREYAIALLALSYVVAVFTSVVTYSFMRAI